MERVVSSRLNGHDRVTRYTSLDDAAFRALVGDDVNGLIESMQDLASAFSDFKTTFSTRAVGLQTAIILLLLGVIADIVVRLQ